jgi:hypothetical protein
VLGLPVPSAPNEAARKAEVDVIAAAVATKVDGATPPVVDGSVVVFSGTTGKQIRMGSVGGAPPVLQGPIAGSGLSMNAQRVLGRTTGGVGPIEELTPGFGLALSAGTLYSTLPALATTPPADLGVAFVGSGITAARNDHVHKLPSAAELGVPPAGPVTGGALTMNPSRLLGRSTAGVGPIEEITLGTNLTFAGGVLNAATTGNVFGPASSTDDFVAVFSGTTGKLLKLGGGPPAIAGSILSSGLTLTGPNRLVGRAASGTGPLESISIGGGLTLVAGVLDSLATLSNATPQPLGVAAPGAASAGSRADHVHRMPTAVEVGAVAAGPILGSGLTLPSQRLAGRSLGTTGGIEEIAIGAGLLLSGGVLSATGGGGGGGGGGTVLPGDTDDPPNPNNPVGRIVWLIRSPDNPPNGYLYCGGQEIFRSTYFELRSVIGDTYGAGDGVATFNVPLEEDLTNPYGSQYRPFIKYGVKLGDEFYTWVAIEGAGYSNLTAILVKSLNSQVIPASPATGGGITNGSWVPGAANSPDGLYAARWMSGVVNGAANAVRVWKYSIANNSFAPLPAFLTNVPISGLIPYSVAFSPDGNWMAIGWAVNNALLPDALVQLYSVNKATDTFTYRSQLSITKQSTTETVAYVLFDPVSSGIILKMGNGINCQLHTIRRNGNTLEYVAVVSPPSPIYDFWNPVFSPNGSWLFIHNSNASNNTFCQSYFYGYNSTDKLLILNSRISLPISSPADVPFRDVVWLDNDLILSDGYLFEWNQAGQTLTRYLLNLVVAGTDMQSNVPVIPIRGYSELRFICGDRYYKVNRAAKKYDWINSGTGAGDLTGYGVPRNGIAKGVFG